jgi:lipopolysaccharide export system permease protein
MAVSFYSPTLFWYLSRRFFITILATTFILGGFVYLLDVVELIRRLSKNTTAPTELAFVMAMYKFPDMALQLAPFILLIGTLISFTRLTRDRELVAIRSTGLPARKFLLPALLVCIAIGVFNLTVLTAVSGVTLKKYEKLNSLYFPGSVQGLVTEGGQVWLRQPEETRELFVYGSKVLEQGRILEGVTLFIFSPAGDFIERLDAEKMERRADRWQLSHVFRLSPAQQVSWLAEYTLTTPLTPEIIANSLSSPQTMSVWQLHNFIKRLKQIGLPTQKHELYYHRLLAMPAFLIGMFLLAAPFALRFSRTHGMGQVLLVGLATGLAFYAFGNVVAAYGLSGRLPPAVAAWMPAAIAALVGAALFLHFREE